MNKEAAIFSCRGVVFLNIALGSGSVGTQTVHFTQETMVCITSPRHDGFHYRKKGDLITFSNQTLTLGGKNEQLLCYFWNHRVGRFEINQMSCEHVFSFINSVKYGRR